MSDPIVESSRSYFSWSAIERIIQVVLTAVVGALVARHLGPAGFGLLNSLWSVAALCWPLAQIGHQVALEAFVLRPEDTEDFAVALAVNVRGAVVSLAVFGIAATALTRDGPTDALLISGLFATTVIVQPLVIGDVWFQARREARLPAVVRSAGLLVAAGLRLAIIAAGFGAVAIAATMSLDVVLPSILLFAALRRRGVATFVRPTNRDRVREFVRRGLPLAIAGLSVAIYMRIDQVMVKLLDGDASAGVYAAAVRISEGTYFLALVLLRMASPRLLRTRSVSKEQYERDLQHLFGQLLGSAVAIAIGLTVLAPFFVDVLFGDGYEGASAVLRVHAWSLVFVFAGVGQSIWFTTEHEDLSIMRRTIFGAGVNVALNLVLIPSYGPAGAAWATLLAYGCVTLIANALFPRTRHLAVLQVRALAPRTQLAVARQGLQALRR